MGNQANENFVKNMYITAMVIEEKSHLAEGMENIMNAILMSNSFDLVFSSLGIREFYDIFKKHHELTDTERSFVEERLKNGK